MLSNSPNGRETHGAPKVLMRSCRLVATSMRMRHCLSAIAGIANVEREIRGALCWTRDRALSTNRVPQVLHQLCEQACTFWALCYVPRCFHA